MTEVQPSSAPARSEAWKTRMEARLRESNRLRKLQQRNRQAEPAQHLLRGSHLYESVRRCLGYADPGNVADVYALRCEVAQFIHDNLNGCGEIAKLGLSRRRYMVAVLSFEDDLGGRTELEALAEIFKVNIVCYTGDGDEVFNDGGAYPNRIDLINANSRYCARLSDDFIVVPSEGSVTGRLSEGENVVKLKSIPKNASSLYHSIFFAICRGRCEPTVKTARLLRSMVVPTGRLNRPPFKDQWTEYCAAVLLDSTPGGADEIAVLANTLGVYITVLNVQ